MRWLPGLLFFAAACGGSSGDTPAAVDAATSVDTATPPPTSALTFDVDGSAVVLHVPADATAIVLTQDLTSLTLTPKDGAARIGTDAEWTAMLPLKPGAAHVSIQGKTPSELDVVLGEHFTRAFEIVGAPFPHDDFVGRATVGQKATFAGTVPDGGMKSSAVIAHPGLTFDDVSLGADKTLAAGAAYSFEVTFKDPGITVVELNAPNGIPLISWPVYVGEALPLVVDLIDRPPTAYYGDPLPMLDLRAAMLAEVSALRQTAGLGPIVAHDKLDQSAQAMADTIASEKYFSHTSKTGKKAKDWVAAQGLSGQIADELAVEFSAERAFRYLFWSPAHRRGMLDPRWRSLGTGTSVFDAATFQLVFVLHFLDSTP